MSEGATCKTQNFIHLLHPEIPFPYHEPSDNGSLFYPVVRRTYSLSSTFSQRALPYSLRPFRDEFSRSMFKSSRRLLVYRTSFYRINCCIQGARSEHNGLCDRRATKKTAKKTLICSSYLLYVPYYFGAGGPHIFLSIAYPHGNPKFYFLNLGHRQLTY
jgi:hypothetical protein